MQRARHGQRRIDQAGTTDLARLAAGGAAGGQAELTYRAPYAVATRVGAGRLVASSLRPAWCPGTASASVVGC